MAVVEQKKEQNVEDLFSAQSDWTCIQKSFPLWIQNHVVCISPGKNYLQNEKGPCGRVISLIGGVPRRCALKSENPG
jgi:hypothetical protein